MMRIAKELLTGVVMMSLAVMGTGFAAAPRMDGVGRAERAETTYREMMGAQSLGIEESDPELADMMKKYIYGDIAHQSVLSRKNQHLATLAVLTTFQNENLLEKNVRGALQDHVTPLEIRETIYHVAPYVGFARVLEAIETANQVFREEGISLPLSKQGTTGDRDRFAKGLAFQVNAYGERINKMRAATPDEQKHLQDDLSAFCFGDIYTRGTLDMKTREMITVAALGALGTAEPQFKSHVRGYMAAGASREEVVGTITVMNPYMGFPRTLNCLRMINEIFSGK
jgi:4-carboxymuconolactone decarboxylase